MTNPTIMPDARGGENPAALRDDPTAYREIEGADALAALGPRAVTLVTTGGTFAPDVAPATWVTPVSQTPPLVAVALRPQSATFRSLSVAGEFVLNVVGPQFAQAADICGATSGHGRDKLARSGIRLAAGEATNAPHVIGALAWVECMVEDLLDIGGDHRIVLAQVMATHMACADGEDDSPAASPDALLALRPGCYATVAHGVVTPATQPGSVPTDDGRPAGTPPEAKDEAEGSLA